MDNRLFEVYYTDAVKYSKTICIQQRITSPPEEFVNDAFIAFIDTGKEFDYNDFKKLIFRAVMSDFQNKISKNHISETSGQPRSGIKEYFCISCCESIPENAFRIVNYNNGYSRIASSCKKCETKKKRKWYSENRDKWLEYITKWRVKKFGKKPPRQAQEIQVLWRKANHKYIEKQREILSDVYVRSLLKKDQRTAENIERKRQELLERRKKAA